MPWSFNPALTEPKDSVRFYIGDTDESDQQLQDETIEALLVVDSDVFRCAALCCRALAAQFSRLSSISGGEDSASLDQLQEHYSTRATELDEVAEQGISAAAYLGGLSYGEQSGRLLDTDRIPPYFDRPASGIDRGLYP